VILKPSDTAELIEKLEDSQMQLGSMATNRYSAPFRDQVQGWIVKLSTVSEVIEQWLIVQNMWMYMEAVFSGGDIVKQLPQEAKRFQNIDKNYMKVGAWSYLAPWLLLLLAHCNGVCARVWKGGYVRRPGQATWYPVLTRAAVCPHICLTDCHVSY
jgi:hypothetical protein